MNHGPVLIIGAGVNGCALARELALNGVPVHLVDERDIGFGATAKSSRLVHGGLRYLEYGDYHLVRESLAERTRLLEVAPQYVRPLRLFIPVARRRGGLRAAAVRFLGLERRPRWRRIAPLLTGRSPRGLWVARLGLWMYDRLAGEAGLGQSSVHRVEVHSAPPAGNGELAPRVDPRKYRWLCSYFDAQIPYPERFLIALLEDAQWLAREQQIDFRIWTYHRAELRDGRVAIRPRDTRGNVDSAAEAVELTPALIVNATGAWGDFTLRELGVPSPPLFGGTKGSHFVTFHPTLRQQLGDGGVYAETPDGRLVFLLPFGAEATLVGTTDIPFPGRPDGAVADPGELDYLLAAANEVFGLDLTRNDIALHYSGVRPLPRSDAATPGGVSRDHWIVPAESAAGPVLTLVGGKLTTCRAFAEIVADAVLARLGRTRCADTRSRIIPGGEDYPRDPEQLHAELSRLSASSGYSVEQLGALWTLWGARTREIIAELADGCDRGNLWGTPLPAAAVRWTIAHEWVTRLEDLVERRLLLVYERDLSRRTLRELAEALAAAGRIEAVGIDDAVEACAERLRTFYGRRLEDGTDAEPRT